MKKLVSTIMVIVMSMSIVGCGGGNKKAFNVSKTAYDNIDIAYEITEEFGEDIYEAWRLGIYEDDEILEDGIKYLAGELSLSEDEIREGAAYALVVNVAKDDWTEISEEDKTYFRDNADYSFELMKDNLFSYCVMVVASAYTVNGKVDEAQTALNTAKEQMKELSEKYSDYEHYPNLKGFYTTTSAFFDFCQNPTGSFEQVKQTINDYRKEGRDYISDLDYIFEE